ncbi:MAG: hypothetical protein AB7L84_16835 [Acidimicrobiia bacterium]
MNPSTKSRLVGVATISGLAFAGFVGTASSASADVSRELFDCVGPEDRCWEACEAAGGNHMSSLNKGVYTCYLTLPDERR